MSATCGKMDVMRKVEALLERRGMIPAELSRMTGISTGRLSKLSQGKGELRIPEALRIARALEVSLDWLADDEATEDDYLSVQETRYLIKMVKDIGLTEAKYRLLARTKPLVDELLAKIQGTQGDDANAEPLAEYSAEPIPDRLKPKRKPKAG